MWHSSKVYESLVSRLIVIPVIFEHIETLSESIYQIAENGFFLILSKCSSFFRFRSTSVLSSLVLAWDVTFVGERMNNKNSQIMCKEIFFSLLNVYRIRSTKLPRFEIECCPLQSFLCWRIQNLNA